MTALTMRREHDGRPAPISRNQLPNCPSTQRVQSRADLVEQQEVGTSGKRTGQLQFSLLTAREVLAEEGDFGRKVTTSEEIQVRFFL
mgnify:CR=1 FL=1|jgi:hypothetical protein